METIPVTIKEMNKEGKIEKHLKFTAEFYIQIFNPTDIDFVHESLNEDLN